MRWPGRRRDRRAVAGRRLAAAGLAALIGIGMPLGAPALEVDRPEAAAAGVSDGRDSLESSAALYDECHWAAAYAMLARMADRGDARASRWALLMARHGPPLFGESFAIGARQARLWAEQADVPGIVERR